MNIWDFWTHYDLNLSLTSPGFIMESAAFHVFTATKRRSIKKYVQLFMVNKQINY